MSRTMTKTLGKNLNDQATGLWYDEQNAKTKPDQKTNANDTRSDRHDMTHHDRKTNIAPTENHKQKIKKKNSNKQQDKKKISQKKKPFAAGSEAVSSCPAAIPRTKSIGNG
ncbi:hypothetical protein JDV02_003375 [Purpureocillium takamizusanense]|uniref:Uncharacterized protein n=1 Tax=Purpureocillium takamizusanense TaxID=2060973 RepID=A0A9Q8QCS1_9HYPO|nr:uncharacterized protein JDV02_003375 [Purpureocillium takamizusanense]UNI16993.1 hypothetical protein JDV02_003375 [Purpureocillium takamizusanense]